MGFSALILRRTSSIATASDEEIQSAISANECLAELCACGVVGGLIVEVFLAACLYYLSREIEQWGAVAANAIIALSICGELFFNKRISQCQAELVSRSRKSASAAHERAATAEREAEELRKQYSWRLLSPDQMGKILKVLRESPNVITISYMAADPDSHYLALQFGKIFQLAGWNVSLHGGMYGGEMLFGVILPRQEDGADDRTALIQRALQGAQFGFNLGPIPRPVTGILTQGNSYVGQRVTNKTPTELFVGPKQPAF